MDFMSVCNNVFLGIFLKLVKDGLKLIQIIGPILLIVSLGFIFIKLIQHPDDKKLFSKIKNALLALVIVFFVPTIVIAVLGMVDEASEFGACWKNGGSGSFGNPEYIDVNGDNDKVNIIGNSQYEQGVPGSTNNGSSSSGSSSSSSSGSSSGTGSNQSSSGTSKPSNNSSSGVGVIGTHTNSKNNITYNLYNQASKEWQGYYYSSGETIQQNGCMNTSVAVVSSAYNKSITPVTVFSKYRHSSPKSSIPKLTNNAFSCSSGKTGKNDIVNALNNGDVVVIKVYGKNKGGSSPFTSSQHYMALIDINGSNVFIGNAYSNSTHGKSGWFNIDKVLTSIQTAEYCYPSSSLKGN